MARTLFELQGQDDRRFSPFCWRARFALAHKGLDTEYEPVKFGEKDKLAFSGQKLVPVLRDGETTVSDSWNIACYLEETYPDRASLFGGEIGRGVARFINAWTDKIVHPALLKIIVCDIHDNAAVAADQPYFRTSREERFGMPLEAYRDASEENIAAFRGLLEPLRQTLDAQPYLSGPAPAYADYIVFGTCKFIELVSAQTLTAEDDPIAEWQAHMRGLFGGMAASPGAAAETA